MRLDEHLSERKIRRSDFAGKVGISEAFLSRLISGERKPGLTTARKIEEETGGAVTLSDWVDGRSLSTTSVGK